MFNTGIISYMSMRQNEIVLTYTVKYKLNSLLPVHETVAM